MSELKKQSMAPAAGRVGKGPTSSQSNLAYLNKRSASLFPSIDEGNSSSRLDQHRPLVHDRMSEIEKLQ